MDIVKLLLEKGADPNQHETSSHDPSNNNNNINNSDSPNRTCLHIAAQFGLSSHLSLLLKSHIIKRDQTDQHGQTALHIACSTRHIECVRAILSTPPIINLDHRDIEGQTALSIACQLGEYTITNELLQAGAQIYASSRNPIKLAHQSGNVELVALLQYWSTLCYQQGYYQHQQQQQILPSIIPRNSKSTESFRSSSARVVGGSLAATPNQQQQQQQQVEREITMPNFNNRCAITPTTFSSYMRNLGHISSSVSASPLVALSTDETAASPPLSKFDMFSARNYLRSAATPPPPSQNRSLLINLSHFDESEVGSSEKSSSNKQESSSKISKLKYVRDKLLRKPSILSNKSENQQQLVSKQRRSNSTYLATTSSSMANNLNANNNLNLTNSNYANSNLMAMASNASSEFSLLRTASAVGSGGVTSPVVASGMARTPGACSIQSSVSFRHHVEARAGAGGANKKPRIVSAIAQQQTLNEDEEVGT